MSMETERTVQHMCGCGAVRSFHSPAFVRHTFTQGVPQKEKRRLYNDTL